MKKTKHILFLTLATFVLAACTQDERTNVTKPLTITAIIAGGADTRATVDGDWEIGDEVALWVQGKGVFQYKVTNAQLGTMTGYYYYQDSDNSSYVQAIYPYSAATGLQNFDSGILWNVEADQNATNNYEGSDLLCSDLKTLTPDGTGMLSFYHQTAKVVVNVTNDGYLSGATDADVSMTIGENNNINLSGTFAPFTRYGETAGEWNNLGTPGTIIPRKATNTRFEALVIPQTVSSGTLFQFYVDDVGPFRYTVPAGGITWNAGKAYTYNVTLNNTTSTRSAGTSECVLELVETRDMNGE